jgi:CRP-like cAMP-binding protein
LRTKWGRIQLEGVSTVEGFERILKEHPFFASLEPEHSLLLASFARNYCFAAGQYLFHEGEPADEFFLIRDGTAALEIAAPGKTPAVIQTLSSGEIAGASWLVPPYRWTSDARAVTPVRAIGIDAGCLRGKCDASSRLGYEMMKRFLPLLAMRLKATRLQFLDVYRAAC